ncbi:hypothetical protein [Streptomyces sp. SID12501]|uniref:Uncharacterized protein n=1 Tax=Streptomyces sp. SID12501 TaxID=2706042 RepID=A0A6B3BKD5_9ACTN|nr:hypothetical protein [Streptomyces sp. SID12501]NEC85075.1 hypothetical protein [Streptomyces sp. SID12501]
MSEWHVVTTAAELLEALAKESEAIEVQGTLSALPPITLPAGVRLRGGTLEFAAKGVRLTRDNTLEDVTIRCAETEVAVGNSTLVADFGTLTLRGVRTTGQVLLLARDQVRAGHVRVEGLTVDAADTRARADRPEGGPGGNYVEVIQGAFTLWNMHTDPTVHITAELLDIATGTAERPVAGVGVFVSGHGRYGLDGGSLAISTLRTGEIHADGGITPGNASLLGGGVFVITGAEVTEVVNAGPVTTHGPNDMVLDNWSQVTTWRTTAPITSYGPSGIGFVNFGTIDRLEIGAPIVTHGAGARGFNLYAGSIRHASFADITTHGDGAVGIQVSMPLPVLDVHGDLTTFGGEALSLVKGVQVPLKAIALSVKPGGDIGRFACTGRIVSHGDDMATVSIEGTVGHFEAADGIAAEGANSDAVHVHGDVPGLEAVTLTVTDGRDRVAV